MFPLSSGGRSTGTRSSLVIGRGRANVFLNRRVLYAEMRKIAFLAISSPACLFVPARKGIYCVKRNTVDRTLAHLKGASIKVRNCAKSTAATQRRAEKLRSEKFAEPNENVKSGVK